MLILIRIIRCRGEESAHDISCNDSENLQSSERLYVSESINDGTCNEYKDIHYQR